MNQSQVAWVSRRVVLCVVWSLLWPASCAVRGQTSAPSTAPAMARSSTQPSDANAKRRVAWYQDCEKRVAEMKGKPVDVIFIGDSITENFIKEPTATWDMVGKSVWEKHYAGRNVLNFGVGADATEHVLWRFEHMDIKGFSPKVAVILIGTNNTQDSPQQIAAGVKAVLDKTRQTFAGVKVILVSILPNARATQKMADANQIIQTFADGKTVNYFDLASKMPPEGNSWKGLGRDRLHLTPAGYELWASEMEPLLSKLLSGN
jgi:lysophospholipase L1-like esterase